MRVSIGDLRELTGPVIRFTLSITDDDGEPLMSYPGWTMNQYREIETPATKTSRGFWKRFTQVTDAFEAQLRTALEDIPETAKILGPKLEKVLRVRKIKGEREIK